MGVTLILFGRSESAFPFCRPLLGEWVFFPYFFPISGDGVYTFVAFEADLVEFGEDIHKSVFFFCVVEA